MTLGELIEKLQDLEVSPETSVWVLGDEGDMWEPSVFMLDEEVMIG